MSEGWHTLSSFFPSRTFIMYRDIYFFLEICPFGTSLLSTGRLFILMCCPTGTFIGSGLLLDPQEYSMNRNHKKMNQETIFWKWSKIETIRTSKNNLPKYLPKIYQIIYQKNFQKIWPKPLSNLSKIKKMTERIVVLCVSFCLIHSL